MYVAVDGKIKYVCFCCAEEEKNYDKVECKKKKFVATGFNRK